MKTCVRFVCAALCVAGALCGQHTAETRVFRARLSPANEVPPITGLDASGAATLVAHVLRDTAGKIVSGSVDFYVAHQFPGEVTFTGLHVHAGAAGTNGPVRIDTGITGQNTVVSPAGRGTIDRQAQVLPDNLNGLAALEGMFANPGGYYVNLHSTVHPAGAIRGQLEAAQTAVLLSVMNPRNEVPPLDLQASALGAFTAHITRDENGGITSAEAIFDVNYTFPGAVTFTGLHIHAGAAGVNGPVRIDSGITGANPVVRETGTGSLFYRVEVPLNANTLPVLEGLLTSPQNYYLNLHTTVNPGGAVRGQMRSTGLMTFQVPMSPANEVPPITNLEATGQALVTIRALRSEAGTIEAGYAVFDINYRFPGAVDFTGLHIHDGLAGANGPVRLDTGITGAASVARATGFGNLTGRVLVTSALGLASLNSLVVHPERHYLNLHTRVHPGGAIRGQIAEARTLSPIVTGAATVGSHLTTAAPGGLLSIYGLDFVKVATDLGGWSGSTLPASLNGVEVSIGGRAAPLLYVSPGQLNVQVPFETEPGARPIVVRFDGEASQAASIQVATVAPFIFTYERGGIVVRNADFSLITPENPAAAGDIVLIYSTGLGQTTPVLETGKPAAYPPAAETARVQVTIGGRAADVVYSIASPGFAGLYQTAVRVPAGVTPGNARLTLSVAGVSSNETTMAVR